MKKMATCRAVSSMPLKNPSSLLKPEYSIAESPSFSMKHLNLLLSLLAVVSVALATKVGDLRTLQHGVRGTVFILDEQTLFIEDFHYDGTGPDAYFYVGTGPRPSRTGQRLMYPPEKNDVSMMENFACRQ